MSTAAKTASEAAALSTIAQAQTLGLVGTNTLSVPLPFESKIVLFERVRIAGTTHAPEIDTIMEAIAENATLRLVREPENQADKWAIRVEYGGKKIGYLPADKNELVARLMDGGKSLEATLIEHEQQGNWWKVYVEVSLID